MYDSYCWLLIVFCFFLNEIFPGESYDDCDSDTSRLNTAKKLIIPKNDSNKGCSELNFLSLSPPEVGLEGSKDLPFLKNYNNAVELESRFTLQLNAVKNTDYVKNFFERSC